MDKSNATFDNTLNSTLDTTGLGANSTKIDDTIIEEENDVVEADENKDEGVDTANDNEAESEDIKVSVQQLHM